MCQADLSMCFIRFPVCEDLVRHPRLVQEKKAELLGAIKTKFADSHH